MIAALIAALALQAQTPSWPDIDTDATGGGGGENDVALVVGVGTYYNLPPIPGAAENAAAWQQWLLRTRKVRPEHVILLHDREATKGKIERNLEALASQVGPRGTLWFIFIGHGAPAASGDDGMLLGVDTDADADSIAERGVPQARVLSLIERGQQGHAVVVFDACFSGKTGDGAATLVPGLQATLPVRSKKPTTAKKLTVLAASDNFAGPLPGAARPAFSYLLLGGLRGWADSNRDHSVHVDEAYDFARGTIQALFKGADRLPSRQGPDVILAKNAKEESPDLAALTSGRCPGGSSWDGRRCKEGPKIECPSGTNWSGSACTSLCPAGTQWSGKACVATTVECPSGTNWNGRACEGQRVAISAVPALAPATVDVAKGGISPIPTPKAYHPVGAPTPARSYSGPRYVPVNDAIVRDQQTGLEWTRQRQDFKSWRDLLDTTCWDLSLDGGSWHPPTAQQLKDFIGSGLPDSVFLMERGYRIVTAAENSGDSPHHYVEVDMSTGEVGSAHVGYRGSTLCLRGGGRVPEAHNPARRLQGLGPREQRRRARHPHGAALVAQLERDQASRGGTGVCVARQRVAPADGR